MGTGMENYIPEFREREWEWKIAFPTFGNGNGNEKIIPKLWERVSRVKAVKTQYSKLEMKLMLFDFPGSTELKIQILFNLKIFPNMNIISFWKATNISVSEYIPSQLPPLLTTTTHLWLLQLGHSTIFQLIAHLTLHYIHTNHSNPCMCAICIVSLCTFYIMFMLLNWYCVLGGHCCGFYNEPS